MLSGPLWTVRRAGRLKFDIMRDRACACGSLPYRARSDQVTVLIVHVQTTGTVLPVLGSYRSTRVSCLLAIRVGGSKFLLNTVHVLFIATTAFCSCRPHRVHVCTLSIVPSFRCSIFHPTATLEFKFLLRVVRYFVLLVLRVLRL